MRRSRPWAAAVLALLALQLAVNWRAAAAAAVVSESSKSACDFSNRLCSWNATYAFGATVLGDKAFFHGGIYSNDATTPVNGSSLDVLDLRTMSPYVIQLVPNVTLNSTRYRHQLVAWRDRLLAVGGQVDDADGTSTHVLNVVALDLNTRTWSLLKQFQPGSTRGSIGFDAVVAAGDHLLVAFQKIDPDDPARMFLSLDLTTAKVDSNYELFKGAMMLDWPLVGVMSLTSSGAPPVLVLQAKRHMPSTELMAWAVIDGQGETGVKSRLPCTAATKLEKLQGGSGGKVLALSIVHILGQPSLVMLATTNVTYALPSRATPFAANVTVLTVHSIALGGAAGGNSSVSLQLTHVLATPPLASNDVTRLRTLNLPMHGNVRVRPGDVTALPYVGRVDLVGDLDASNANIQATSSGLVIRGSSVADYVCQPAATWQPFVMRVDFRPGAPAVATAVSNYTWCATRADQEAAAQIVSNSAKLRTNAKLFRVEQPDGPALMMLSAQAGSNPGAQLPIVDRQKPLMGAYISLKHSTVANFTVSPPASYSWPEAAASCLTNVSGRPTYIEAGGFSMDSQSSKEAVSGAVFAMEVSAPRSPHELAPVTGSVPPRAASALACSPDGSVYMFGGLLAGNYTQRSDGKAAWYETRWTPKADMLGFRLSRAGARTVLTQTSVAAAAAAPQPAPRGGHALVFMPPAALAKLGGFREGGVLLFGGSDVPSPNLDTLAPDVAAAMLANSSWDRSAWLYDIAAAKWARLDPLGEAPPGLMHHSMAVQGSQALLFGGFDFNATSHDVTISKALFVLDFSEAVPRWRHAAVGNINLQGTYAFAFPSTGIVAMPEDGVVALKHRSTVSLAPIPQSLVMTGSTQELRQWGLNTLNLTAGDWVRLAPASPSISISQPLLLAGDVIVSGVAPAPGGRHLLQQAGAPTLTCGPKAPSAVVIRSSGTVLENLVLRGCKGSAVDVQTDATGAYAAPAVLRNLTITANSGVDGAAVRVAAYASATLQRCRINANTARGSVVSAGDRSQLELLDSTLAGNNGTALSFAGTQLVVERCAFRDNTAAARGGAMRLECLQRGPGGYASVTSIVNSSFTGCSARGNGGAIYLGPGTTASLANSTLAGNRAGNGGALFADRDACVADIANCTFRDNGARDKGGAVMMRNPSCEELGWNRTLFVNNTAKDGGAMHLSELAARTIRGSGNFTGNMANSTTVGRGVGGALFVGLWGSRVLLNDSTFDQNRAVSHGGALHALAVDASTVVLHNTTATGNRVGLSLPGTATGNASEVVRHELLRQLLRSEGGAVHVTGSMAVLELDNCSLSGNIAGRGGAVSFNSELGKLRVVNSSLDANAAMTAGGGIAVTERKAVNISRTNFTDNQLVWRDLAAGGGLYCFLCSRVSISGSRFARNRACFGGGAAVLQPEAASSVKDSVFDGNVAEPDPWPAANEAATRRRLLAKHAFSGELPVDPTTLGGQAAAAALLGPVAANTTGDSGVYSGGGGLYLSLEGGFSISGTAFVRNTAYNGGGLLARTDACSNAASQPRCGLQLARVAIQGNNATAGGGLLITNISRSTVRLAHCKEGTALSSATQACLERDNALSSALWAKAARRSLLQAAGAGAAGNSTLAPERRNLASTGYGNLLLTTTANVSCAQLSDPTGAAYKPESCSVPIRAAPGLPFNPSFVLLDGLGERVQNGIYDAQMPMAAVVSYANESAAGPILLLGNTTTAVNGTADFRGLTVNGQPGDAFRLRFVTQNGLSAPRDLVLRACQAGESTSFANYSGVLSYKCLDCPAPTYSFYPHNASCSQCSALAPTAVAVCNRAAVVPAAGFYQSHPRNPLLVRCINALACTRSGNTTEAMALWAYEHAPLTTAQINAAPGLLAEYMGAMCSPGYTGPLCGSCSAGFGHIGHSCVRCLSPVWNAVVYFLVCCFMFTIPALQMLMHSKAVKKRTMELREAVTKAGFTMPWPVADEAAAAAEDAAAGGAKQSMLRELRRHSSGKDAGGWADQNGSLHQPSSGSLANSPFTLADATLVDANGSGAQLADADANAGLGSQAGSMSLYSRLFGVESLQDNEVSSWGVANANLRSKLSASTLRGASNASSAGPSVSQTGLPPALGQLGASAKLSGIHSSRARPAIHRRIFKFWHTDVLTMLVNYMQLLGLLRLVRINWHETLSQLLVYLDFTSGATTWASLECSLSNRGLPRSVKRSMVVLLWPVGALLLLCGFWAVSCLVLKRGRRPLRFRRRVLPHVIMSAVIMLYFLYTPTSREIISLFSCQAVDDPDRLPPEVGRHDTSNPAYRDALAAMPHRSDDSLWPGFWTSDTSLQCGSAAHLGLAIGFGITGLVLFVFGLPVTLWVLLWRNSRRVDGHSKLEDPTVELKYGLMYDKYRYRCYYWECVILLENCALTLLLVMLQTVNNATLQVLVAMAVIFIEAVLHITFQPYACRMLDTLRRLSVYGLMSTLFFMMLVTLSDMQRQSRLVVACMVVILIINVSVIGVHLWACASELLRWFAFVLAKQGRAFTWPDISAFVCERLAACFRPRGGGGGGGGGAAPPPAVRTGRQPGPPQETAVGTAHVVLPSGSGPQRDGAVVVVNPRLADDGDGGSAPGAQTGAAATPADAAFWPAAPRRSSS